MDELHRISQILIERETIDKDQFERLLAGEDESDVFPTSHADARTRADRPRPSRSPSRGPFPARAQPPPPEPTAKREAARSRYQVDPAAPGR